MSPKPVVSVIIPTVRRPHRLWRALESVGRQSYPHVEAVVVNDGGVPVDDVVARYQARYDRPIRYVVLPINRGLPAARNAGSVAATGEILALLDDDDRYLPTHLEHLVAALVQHAAAVLAYDDVQIQIEDGTEDDPDPRVVATCRFGRPYERAIFDVEDYIITSATAFRRSDFEAVGKFDESMPSCEDWDLLLRLRDRGELRYVGGAIGVEYSQRLQAADHLGSRFDAGRQAALDLLSARYDLPPLVPKTFLDVARDLGCVPTPVQRAGDLGTAPNPKP